MAKNSDASASDNGKDAAKPHESEANSAMNTLPMVVAPKLGAGEEEVTEESVTEEAPLAAAPVHTARFLVLAASVAFAAAFGSFVGSVSGSGMAHYLYSPESATGVANTTDAMREINLELADFAMIKADLENTSRASTSQFAKLSDPLDRIDQRTMSADVTGSIAPPASAPAALKFTDRILQDWTVQDVQNGRALVENRHGGVFDIGIGSTLPGVGHVDTIKRQDGQWVVLTERGTITSGR